MTVKDIKAKDIKVGDVLCYSWEVKKVQRLPHSVVVTSRSKGTAIDSTMNYSNETVLRIEI